MPYVSYDMLYVKSTASTIEKISKKKTFFFVVGLEFFVDLFKTQNRHTHHTIRYCLCRLWTGKKQNNNNTTVCIHREKKREREEERRYQKMKVPTVSVFAGLIFMAMYDYIIYQPFLSMGNYYEATLSSSSSIPTTTTTVYEYRLNPFHAPSWVERYPMEHAVEWNYHRRSPPPPLDGLGLRQEGIQPQQQQQDYEEISNLPPPRGCDLWNPSETPFSLYLQTYRTELELYNDLLYHHPGSPIHDIRRRQEVTTTWNTTMTTTTATTTRTTVDPEWSMPIPPTTSKPTDICSMLNIHPQGLGAIFSSGSLSRNPNGLIEPIVPPFRSLNVCSRNLTDLQKTRMNTWWNSLFLRRNKQKQRQHPTNNNDNNKNPMDYLVHDFAYACQHIHPYSKIIWLEIGYGVSQSWDSFRSAGHDDPDSDTTNNEDHQDHSSSATLIHLYRKFGFPIDSIYTFDSQQSSHDKTRSEYTTQITHQTPHWNNQSTTSLPPETVTTEQLPNFVDTKTGRTNHPWDFLASVAQPHDLVVVTIRWPPRGIDPTPEIDLVKELRHPGMKDDDEDPSAVVPLIDHLYLKASVYMEEDEEEEYTRGILSVNDQQQIHESTNVPSSRSLTTQQWTVQEAMYVFDELRRMGIPAHTWV